jgi:hypothetical protein
MIVSRPNRFIAVYLGLVASAGAIASALGLARAWDGSWLLFEILDTGRPISPSSRWINVPLELPAIAVRHLTENVGVMSALYGLPYFLVPAIALATSWWVVRTREPRLFVWAALGIGLVSLPGQVFAVSEVVIAMQLTWPVFLAVLAGTLSERRLVVAVLGAALVMTAPTVIPLLLGLAATVALLVLIDRDRPRGDVPWIAAFLALAVAAAIRSIASNDIASHAVEFAPDVLRFRFVDGVLGFPLVAVLLGYLAGSLLVVGSWSRQAATTGARWVDRLAIVATLLAGASLVVWALDDRAWSTAVNYRTWLPALSAPLFGLAFLDAKVLRASARVVRLDGRDAAAAGATAPDGSARRRLALAQAVAMLLVLAIVGLSWRGLNQRLGDEITATPAGCVARSELASIRGTALDHWSLTADSLLLGGRRPSHVVLPTCSVDFSTGVRVTPWHLRRYAGGWFNFSVLRNSLPPMP